MRLLPGDVVQQISGETAQLSEESRQEVRKELGLDKPIFQQYFIWMSHVLRGDLGTSLQTKVSVASELKNRLPVTAELGILALLLSLSVSLPIGVFAAIRQDTVLDYIARSGAIAFLSIPSFWMGTLVVVMPNKWWGWAPPIQYFDIWDNPTQNLYMLIIPAAILGMLLSGTVMRMTRAQMLEVLRQDYVRTAWSKGLRERTVITRHAIRNAFIPVITIIGLQIPILVGGTVILETIFGIPGMGRYLLFSIASLDYPVVQAVNLIVASVVILTNLAVDITYAYLDPRIRFA
ncbi:MAG TPA: ABC transporter permease [Dehalococcoidia bacterium]|nr:ABC transporter permease [Dehalococcoidia bacterium]